LVNTLRRCHSTVRGLSLDPPVKVPEFAGN
jgi:hypothetical protein